MAEIDVIDEKGNRERFACERAGVGYDGEHKSYFFTCSNGRSIAPSSEDAGVRLGRFAGKAVQKGARAAYGLVRGAVSGLTG